MNGKTPFNAIETRGTVRLALKSLGLEADSVPSEQMRLVVEKVLPAELEARGVPQSVEICQALALKMLGIEFQAPRFAAPDAVFERLGRSAKQ